MFHAASAIRRDDPGLRGIGLQQSGDEAASLRFEMTQHADLVVESGRRVRAVIILDHPAIEREVHGRPKRVFDFQHGTKGCSTSVRARSVSSRFIVQIRLLGIRFIAQSQSATRPSWSHQSLGRFEQRTKRRIYLIKATKIRQRSRRPGHPTKILRRHGSACRGRAKRDPRHRAPENSCGMALPLLRPRTAIKVRDFGAVRITISIHIHTHSHGEI